MTTEKVEEMRKRVMATPNKMCKTKVYLYFIDGSGHLCRQRISDLDTTAMYKPNATETLD